LKANSINATNGSRFMERSLAVLFRSSADPKEA
jgi:hypothetical protein